MTAACGAKCDAVSAAASAFVYYRRGLMPPVITGIMVLGVLMGSFAGMKLLYRAKAGKLQLAFSLLVFAVGLRMLIK